MANDLLNFSFADEFGSLTINIFLFSNSQLSVTISSVSFLKLWIVSLAKLDGKPAFQYFSLVLHISLSKLDALTLSLYLTGNLELQCKGNLLSLLKTCADIYPFSLISSVSKSFDRFTSMINLMF